VAAAVVLALLELPQPLELGQALQLQLELVDRAVLALVAMALLLYLAQLHQAAAAVAVFLAAAQLRTAALAAVDLVV
jgi:uncharacterized Zn finger protein